VLSARPYAQVELRLSADAEEACLWPGGGAEPVSFRSDGLGAAACQRQTPTSAAMPAAVHHGDGSVTILPAKAAMDFPGDRLRAYTVSADGRTLFVAVAADGKGDPQAVAATELRRYGLRDDRWAMVGAPLPAAGAVVALSLSDTTSLGIATRQDGPAGAAYQIEARAFEPQDTAPALILHGFVPSKTDEPIFTLCFDVRDPTAPLALHRKDGVRFRVGPAQVAAAPPQEAAARAVPDDQPTPAPAPPAQDDLVAEVLSAKNLWFLRILRIISIATPKYTPKLAWH
jgi:hypothetical protein